MAVQGYLGCVLDSAGEPIGTCFQASPGVLVTAAHLLADAGSVSALEVRPLHPRGPVVEAAVRQVDVQHDLAVLVAAEPLPASVGTLSASGDQRLGQAVEVTGFGDVPGADRPHGYLDALGVWAGGTVVDGAELARLRCPDLLRGMSGAPVRRAVDDAVVGVVSARYNSGDGWLRDTVWVARTEDLAPLLAGLSPLALHTSSAKPGPFESAARTLDVLSAVDSALRGQSDILRVEVQRLVDDVAAGSPHGRKFRERLQRYGLEPALMLTWVPQHARAVVQWTRGDDGSSAELLTRLRARLADAVESGLVPAGTTTAASVAEAIRGTPRHPDFAAQLIAHVREARSTSWEAVLVRADPDAPASAGRIGGHTSGDGDAEREVNARTQRLAHVARRMCALKPASRYLTGRSEVVDSLCVAAAASEDPPVLWISGRPGVGASEVALHVAHRMATEYDTSLYVDLYGSQGTRRDTRTVARLLLEALGESANSDLISDDVLYDRVAEALGATRSLLVLDNAKDPGDVAPLVRGGGATAVIVTSRQRVQQLSGPGLAAHLPVLDRADSTVLLSKFSSAPVSAADLDRVAELCDDLPLALCLLGSRLAARPEVPVQHWIRLLADEKKRLALLGDHERTVRAAILLGYHDLADEERRTTRYLSALPGGLGNDRELASGLATDLAAADLSLHRVADASMAECLPAPVAQPSGHLVFQLPQLIRLVAAERLGAEEQPDAVSAFHRRTVRYFADRTAEIVAASPNADLTLEVDPSRAEAALDHALLEGWWAEAGSLASDLRAVYRTAWDIPGLVRAAQAMVAVSEGTGEYKNVFHALRDVAEVYDSIPDLRPEALSWAEQAFAAALMCDLPQPLLDASLLVADIAVRLERHDVAFAVKLQALDLLDKAGKGDEAVTLLINLVKLARRAPEGLRPPEDLVHWARQAVEIADRVADLDGRASAHFELARILEADKDDKEAAIRHYRTAADLFAATGQKSNVAVCAANTAQLLDHDDDRAEAAWHEAAVGWQAQANDRERRARALVMLSHVRYRLSRPADASAALAEAESACPPNATAMAWEIKVRRAALAYLSGTPFDLPEHPALEGKADGKEPRSSSALVTAAAEAVTKRGATGPLDRLLRHPTVTRVAGYDFWLHTSRLGAADRTRELGTRT